MTGVFEGETSRLLPRAKRRERMEFALPTINVIFLLMLYFLVAGTIVQKDELSVVPPVTSASATTRLPRPLLVITDASTFTLDGVPVDRANIVGAAAAAITDPDAETAQLNVLAPREMAAAPFLEILAEFGAGGVPVRLVTVEAEPDP